MEQKFTGKPFHNSDQVPCTAGVFAESKSTCDAQLRGQRCEVLAIDHFLKKNWKLSARRWKNKIAEIDLVFVQADSGSGPVLFVEVKCLSQSLSDFPRLKARQIWKLRQCHFFYQEKTRRKIQFLVCFVSLKSSEIYEMDLSEF